MEWISWWIGWFSVWVRDRNRCESKHQLESSVPLAFTLISWIIRTHHSQKLQCGCGLSEPDRSSETSKTLRWRFLQYEAIPTWPEHGTQTGNSFSASLSLSVCFLPQLGVCMRTPLIKLDWWSSICALFFWNVDPETGRTSYWAAYTYTHTHTSWVFVQRV